MDYTFRLFFNKQLESLKIGKQLHFSSPTYKSTYI